MSLNTDTLNITEYVNHLYKTYGCNEMCNIIKENNFLVNVPSQFQNTIYENKIIKIMYKEYCKLWKPKWARQCRGVILFLDDDNIIKCIKYQLQRGAEVLTGLQIKNGQHDTQDLDIKNISHLSNTQQETIKLLASKSQIDGFLSFKCDGSLIGITLYSGKFYDIAKLWVEQFGDDFAKVVLKISIKLGCDFVPIISTQNTFMISEMMHSYFVTSVLDALNIKNYDELVKLTKVSKSHDIFELYGHILFEKISHVRKYYNHDIITINFEAVCKNRTCANNELHNEFAISYPNSMFKLLGISIVDDICHIPHMLLPPELKYKMNFEEPL